MRKKGVKLKICQVSKMNAVNILITVRLVVWYVVCAFNFFFFFYYTYYVMLCCHLYVVSCCTHTHWIAHFVQTEWYLVPIKMRPPPKKREIHMRTGHWTVQCGAWRDTLLLSAADEMNQSERLLLLLLYHFDKFSKINYVCVRAHWKTWINLYLKFRLKWIKFDITSTCTFHIAAVYFSSYHTLKIILTTQKPTNRHKEGKGDRERIRIRSKETVHDQNIWILCSIIKAINVFTQHILGWYTQKHRFLWYYTKNCFVFRRDSIWMNSTKTFVRKITTITKATNTKCNLFRRHHQIGGFYFHFVRLFSQKKMNNIRLHFITSYV